MVRFWRRACSHEAAHARPETTLDCLCIACERLVVVALGIAAMECVLEEEGAGHEGGVCNYFTFTRVCECNMLPCEWASTLEQSHCAAHSWSIHLNYAIS